MMRVRFPLTAPDNAFRSAKKGILGVTGKHIRMSTDVVFLTVNMLNHVTVLSRMFLVLVALLSILQK